MFVLVTYIQVNACEEELKHAIDAEHLEQLVTAISRAAFAQVRSLGVYYHIGIITL